MHFKPPIGPPATLGDVRWLDALWLLASCKACAQELTLFASVAAVSAHTFCLAGPARRRPSTRLQMIGLAIALDLDGKSRPLS